jgi:hypothetical protein
VKRALIQKKNAGPPQLSPKKVPSIMRFAARDNCFFAIGDVLFQHEENLINVRDMEHGDTSASPEATHLRAIAAVENQVSTIR